MGKGYPTDDPGTIATGLIAIITAIARRMAETARDARTTVRGMTGQGAPSQAHQYLWLWPPKKP
jgi:hypothetical protein